MEYDTIKLLNLEDVDINLEKSFVEKVDGFLICSIVLNSNTNSCPLCGSTNISINDYRTKKIVHSISTHQPCILRYKARRFICKDCKSTFYEHNPFCQKDEKLSLFTDLLILDKLRSHTSTFTSVAKDLNVSVQTVINVFDKYVQASRLPLSEVICMDELYTNKLTHRKYSCIILNFFTNNIIDIYPSRLKYDLINYIYRIPLEERKRVKFVVIDMWDTYKFVALSAFPNCLVAVDSFHVINHLNAAMDFIRLQAMRKYDKGHARLQNADIYYYMLKKFHYFFTKNYDNIYDGKIKIPKLKVKWHKDEIRKFLFSMDDDLRYAYELKVKYQEFNLTATYDTCDEEFDYLISQFLDSHIDEFRVFGRLLLRWKTEIKNSFIRIDGKRLSNGGMENCNSRLKCIIKNANGYKNFDRFRNKCFFSINKQTPIKNYKK